jgi:hypothetical protein
MRRLIPFVCAVTMVVALGCNSRPEGMISVTSAGSLQLQHEIFWTQETMDWDVRVDCTRSGSVGHQTLHVSAYDNTFRDGLFLDLRVQEFSGNGDYVRTENQPLSALRLTLTDDLTDTWTLDTSSGGACDFTIDSAGRTGTYTCTDVYGWVSETLTFADIEISGEWSCTGIYWEDDPLTE